MVKYEISKNQKTARISNEIVILDVKLGEYFGLNEIGSFIFEEIESSPKTFLEIKKSILNEYDIDEETCQIDLKEVLKALLENNIIHEV